MSKSLPDLRVFELNESRCNPAGQSCTFHNHFPDKPDPDISRDRRSHLVSRDKHSQNDIRRFEERTYPKKYSWHLNTRRVRYWKEKTSGSPIVQIFKWWSENPGGGGGAEAVMGVKNCPKLCYVVKNSSDTKTYTALKGIDVGFANECYRILCS